MTTAEVRTEETDSEFANRLKKFVSTAKKVVMGEEEEEKKGVNFSHHVAQWSVVTAEEHTET